MDLDSKRLDVVGPICSAGEVGQVELDLVPAFIESHRHRTDERFHTSCGLKGVKNRTGRSTSCMLRMRKKV